MTELFTSNADYIRVLKVVEGTSVDGPGLRTSIYCAGCTNQCPGCHNPQSWDELGGEPRSVEDLFEQIKEADMSVTFTGGDPMLHPEGFTRLARLIHEHLHTDIWCYTGYTFEWLMKQPAQLELLKEIDVLVDSPFILAERDLTLRFRGSRNQRILDVPLSLTNQKAMPFVLD